MMNERRSARSRGPFETSGLKAIDIREFTVCGAGSRSHPGRVVHEAKTVRRAVGEGAGVPLAVDCCRLPALRRKSQNGVVDHDRGNRGTACGLGVDRGGAAVTYDVVVVGGRCAGSALALLLARAGQSVLVLDRTRISSDVVSTHWLQRPGIRLLDRWGVLDPLVATGCPPINHVRLNSADWTVTGVPTEPGGVAVTFAPRRAVLDPLLATLAREAGAERRDETTVTGVLEEDGVVGGVRATMADGRTFTAHARLVVGADGRSSTVARAVGARMLVDQGALAATAYGYWSGVPVEGVDASFRDGAGLSLWPTHDGLTVAAIVARRSEWMAYGHGAEDTYRHWLNRFPEVVERLRQGRLEGRVHAAVTMRNYFRQSRGPGWALIGDAGHHKDPISARGMSDAFADAELLNKAIQDAFAGGRDISRMLDRYQARRDAARAQMFEYTCFQARLRTGGQELRRFLRTAPDTAQAVGERLGVFVGGRPISDLFDRDPADPAVTGSGAA